MCLLPYRSIKGVNDAEEFAGLKRSMSIVGIENAEQDNTFRLLSATLMLGELVSGSCRI